MPTCQKIPNYDYVIHFWSLIPTIKYILVSGCNNQLQIYECTGTIKTSMGIKPMFASYTWDPEYPIKKYPEKHTIKSCEYKWISSLKAVMSVGRPKMKRDAGVKAVFY